MKLEQMIARYKELCAIPEDSMTQMEIREYLNLHGALVTLQQDLGPIAEFNALQGKSDGSFAQKALEDIDEAINAGVSR